ncbi:MAG: hypothetical protein ACI8XO_001042 [Verrucomicrobiales bacterium]|jgi:hypothetical protein
MKRITSPRLLFARAIVTRLVVLVTFAAIATATPAAVAGSDAINRAALILAGIAPSGREKVTTTQAWKTHASAMQEEWSSYEASMLRPMAHWATTEIAPRCKGQQVVRYLFSGPDVLHVLRMFPDADTYILGGLEPIGVAPDLDRLDGRSASWAFAEVRKSLEEIIRFGFFKTKDMKVDLNHATFPGTLPIMCLFLAHSGHTITGIEFLKLNKDGTLQSLGDKPAGADAVKIATKPKSGRTKTILYFRTNVADGYIEKSGFLTFLQSQPRGGAYLKAASYLLHNSYFSKVRSHLLDSSQVIVQDDSGIPLKFFDRLQWTVGLYGRYTRPIDLFKDDYQGDLHRAFKGKAVKPLPFGTGYRWRKNDSNLIVAERGGEGARALAGAAPRAIPVRVPSERPKPIERTVAAVAGQAAAAGGAVVLSLELLKPSTLESPQATPGGKALGLFEYRVLAVESGSYPNEKIRIAHGIVWDGRFTGIARKEAGWSTSIELVPIATYPTLMNLPLENDLSADSDIPIYVPKLD